MFMYVLCAFILFLHSLERDSQPTKEKVNEDLSLDKPLHVIYKVSKLAHRIRVILIANNKKKAFYFVVVDCASSFYDFLY
jgi:hypothetical protein